MNKLTLTAVIDGDPFVFHARRNAGESNAIVTIRLVKAVLAFIEAGEYEDWESAEWEWTNTG